MLRELFHRFFKWFQRETLHAVHEDDVELIFENIGMLTQLENGELRCHFCGRTITKDNLGTLYKHEGDIRFSCDNLSCYSQAQDLSTHEE